MKLQLQHQVNIQIDWLDLLVVRGTLKSFLQHHNLKASILQHSAFFMVQLSHLYMTTGKGSFLPLTNYLVSFLTSDVF